MNKLIVDKYVITTDSTDISSILLFLKKYNIRAYNYKVLYINSRLFVRVILNDNVILAIENLPLDKAEEIIPKEKIQESKYYIEFHNVYPSDIDFFNSLFFNSAEFHVFPSYILCKIEDYRCKVKDKNQLLVLSEIFDEVKKVTRPFNMNYLISKEKEKMLCEIISRYRGIRDPNKFAC